MALKQNHAEGGVNGLVLTTANSGGSSGTPFDQVTLVGSSSISFSNTTAAHGTLSYHVSGASGDTAKAYLYGDGGINAAMRAYVYFNALPNVAQTLFVLQNTSFSAAVSIGLNATNRIIVQDNSGATIYSAPAALQAATWYRFEVQTSTGVGSATVNFQYYLDDSISPIASFTTTSANTGNAQISRALFGKNNASATLNANFDDIAFDDTTLVPIGPFVSSSNAPTSNAGSNQSNIEPYTTIILQGSDNDSDGTIITRNWRQISGQPVNLMGSGSQRTYEAPGTLNGTLLTFGYTVTDNEGASSAESTVTHSILSSTERAVIGGLEVPIQIKLIVAGNEVFQQLWTAKNSELVRRGMEAQDSFIIGTTKPVLINPDSPMSGDNVGAAFGWNGIVLEVMNGDQTIPANTTWTNKLIHGYVNFTDSSSRLINSVVDGRAPGGTFRAGLVNGANGGYLERCTIRASAAAAVYYMNGIRSTGGIWTINRCDISRVVDGLRASGSGGMRAYGSRMHDYSFFDNDADQSDDTIHPYWSHGDIGIQRTNGNANSDWLEGCSMEGFFDVTGVTWSGGSWGSGVASGGLIGMPSTALNNGYPQRNYANVVTYSGVQPYTGMTFLNNWINGGSHPSGLIQMTVNGNHNFRLEGNRFALGGKPGGGLNRLFLCAYASTSTVNFGTNPNIFDSSPDTPASLWGTPLTFTATGSTVIPENYN